MASAVTDRRRWTVATVLLVLAVAAALIFWQYRRADQAERAIGLDATRMLAEVFQAKRDLRVGRLTGTVLARSQHDGMVFDSTQETRAPATVDYMLAIDRARLAWDADAKRMTVRIPDITVEPPAVDMARAEVRQNGLWISRAAGTELQREAAQRIAVRADERAHADANMTAARRAAVASVRALVERPLAAAGLGEVEVAVVFPWQGGASSEQWDRSRNLDQVRRGEFDPK